MTKIKNFQEFLKEEAQNTFDSSKLNGKLDFVYLNKDSNLDKIKELCETIKLPENKNYITGIVIKPEFVAEIKKYLEDTDLKIISVISLPDGNVKNSEKIKEIRKTISEGADEVNVVMNYTKLKGAISETDEEKKDNMLKDIQTDIRSLVEMCKEKSKTLKVIIEMESLIDKDMISKAVEICKNTNVDFITTSSGIYEKSTNYSFENKLKDVTDIIIPMIQGMDDLSVNINGGVNTIDRVMECLKINKIQRISTTVLPKELFKK